MAEQIEDKREKIQAFLLAKECYSMKLGLLTNAAVVDDAMKFVSEHSTDNNKKLISSKKEDSISQESKEPDHTTELEKNMKSEQKK
jgi:hypothetical protein